MKKTLRGSLSPPGSPHENDQYLIFEQHDPPLLIFASDLDLAMLHKSKHIVCDATFQNRPCKIECAQMYVITGFVENEAVPLVLALMPNKAESTYVKVLQEVRTALVNNHGDIGALQDGFAHMDFENAGINAFRTVFPEMTVKGCRFHFMQALNKKIGDLGLKAVYDQSPASGFNLPQYRCVKKWIRTLGALQFLPPSLIQTAFKDLPTLSNPPVTNNPVVDEKLAEFKDYFQKQWMTDRLVPILSCYDHDGPRTTNHSEGTNNAFRVKFEKERPRLAVFLVSYQEIHHANQIRIRQLLGGAQPVRRRPEDIQKDADVVKYRNDFYQFWQSLVGNTNFQQLLNQGMVDHLHKCCRF